MSVRHTVKEAAAVVGLSIALATALGVIHGIPTGRAVADPSAQSCAPPDADKPSIQWVTQDQAKGLLARPDVAFVDARPQDEFVQGHIAGSLSVPIEDGTVDDAVIQMLGGSRTVITYCDTVGQCALSTRLASLLAEAGMRDVRVLEGGLPAWLENEYPAEAGTCRLCPKD